MRERVVRCATYCPATLRGARCRTGIGGSMAKLLFCVLVAIGISTAVFAQSIAPAGQPSSAPTRISPSVQTPAVAPNGASQPSPAVGDTKSVQKQHDPQKQCVDTNEFAVELKSGIRPVGDEIVVDTNFLPTNQHVDVGIRSAFVDGTRYFAGFDREDGDQKLLPRQDVVTRRAVVADTLVKKHLLEADQTVVTLTIDDGIAGLWHKADLYLYTCGTIGSPARVSRISVRLSPHWYS